MDEINRVMEGKGHTVHQIMTAILAGGHILIEDIPGVGKTTLALAFSKVLGLDYQRIQFTPDIMPTDIAAIAFGSFSGLERLIVISISPYGLFTFHFISFLTRSLRI